MGDGAGRGISLHTSGIIQLEQCLAFINRRKDNGDGRSKEDDRPHNKRNLADVLKENNVRIYTEKYFPAMKKKPAVFCRYL